LRIQPYRTLDNVIEGAVHDLHVNISEMKRIRRAGTCTRPTDLLRLAVVVRDAQRRHHGAGPEGRITGLEPGRPAPVRLERSAGAA
jgi:two-component system CheB/CheR fusion protein